MTKKIEIQAAQGDVLFTKVGVIPDGYAASKPDSDTHIITHSESSHHHVMDSENVDFYQAANDPFTAYIDVKKETELKHLRSFDTHETLLFPVGLFRINRQKEMTPKGWERVAD